MEEKRFITETKMFDGRMTYCEVLTDEEGIHRIVFNHLSGYPKKVSCMIGSPEELARWCDDIKAIALEKANHDKLMAERAKQQQMAEEEREKIRQRLKQAQKEKTIKMKLIKAQQKEVEEPTLF